MVGKGGYIYFVSNKSRSVLYLGVTSNLYSRAWQHKNNDGSAFTRKYQCYDLVYYEFFDSIEAAIAREKQLKKWKRAWKDELIKEFNPTLKDLFYDIEEYQ